MLISSHSTPAIYLIFFLNLAFQATRALLFSFKDTCIVASEVNVRSKVRTVFVTAGADLGVVRSNPPLPR